MKTRTNFLQTTNDIKSMKKIFSNILCKLITPQIIGIFLLTVNLEAQSLDCSNSEPAFSEDETLCSMYDYPTFISQVDYYLGEGTFITKASQLTGPITGEILIAGDFLVDVPFTIYDAVIWVWPDNKIEVNYGLATALDPGYSNDHNRRPVLTLDNCDIFSCDYLWKGIEMGSKTTLIIKNDSRIEDAEKAVYAINTNGVILDITETTFNRNLNGIYLSNGSFFLHDPIFKKFKGNSFSCTSALTASTYIEYENKSSETGIYLNNINANIGSLPGTFQDYTTFENIDYGIKIIGNTSFLRANFLNFSLCWKSDVHLTGGSSFEISNSKFLKVYNTGIYGQSLRNLNVNSCEFHFDNFGIAEEPDSKGIWLDAFPYGGMVKIENSNDFITDNPIDNPNLDGKNCKGIYIKGNQSNSNVEVRISNNNNFDFSGYSLQCIELDGTFNDSYKCNIDENNNFYIHADGTSSNNLTVGINLINGNKTKVNIVGNNFRGHGQLLGSLSYGIRARGSMGIGTNVSNNEFGEYGLVDFQLADCVSLSSYQNTKICNNTDYFGAYNSFVFQGLSYNTDLVANTVYGSGHGVWMPNSNGVIGQQIHRGNKFYSVTTSQPPATLWWLPRCQSLADPMLSHFFVHTEQSVFDPNIPGGGWTYFSEYFPGDIDPGNDPGEEGLWWETDELGTPAEFCSSRNELYVDTVDILIAEDAIGDSSWTDASKWDSKRYLYLKLMTDITYTAKSEKFSDFLEDNENGIINKLFIIEHLIKKSSTRTSSEILALDTLEMKIMKECYYRDSIAAISSWSNSNTSSLNQIYSNLDTLRDSLNLIDVNQSDYAISYLDSVDILLNALGVQSEGYIENTRKFYIYLVDLMKNGYDGLSSSEIEDILDRANQCPDEGGFAVFGLRGLLDNCSGSELMEHLVQCDSFPSLEPILPDTVYSSSPFAINPNTSILSEDDNPAYQTVEEIDNAVHESCISKLDIFSIDGHLVYSTNSQFDQIKYEEINARLNNFPSQLFIWHLYKCDGSVIILKSMNSK